MLTPTVIANIVYGIGIVALFMLDRDPKARPSGALWIPVMWLAINGSRPISMWFTGEALSAAADGNPIDALVFGVLVVLGLAVIANRRKEAAKILRANLAILIFFLYCALSIVWSDFPFIALKRYVKAIGDVVMVLIVLTDPYRSAAIQKVIASVGFILMPASVLLIKYYPNIGRGYHRGDDHPLYTGVTTNKNMLGMICLVVGLATLWRLLQVLRSNRVRLTNRPLIAQVILFFLVLWLLMLTNSMTSISCLFMAGTMMVAMTFSSSARRPAFVHAMIAGAVVVASSTLFLGAGGSMLNTLGRDSSLTGRTEVWGDVLELDQSPILGNGFESFWLGPRLEALWAKYWWHPNEAHNGYLEVFLNLGWAGIALLAVLIFTSYRNILEMLRWEPDLSRLRLAYFMTAVTYSFTEAGFRMMNPIWVLFLLSGMLVSRAQTKNGTSRSTVELLPAWAPAKVPPVPETLPARTEGVKRWTDQD